MKNGILEYFSARVSLIERGVAPKPKEAQRLSETLGVSEEELFCNGFAMGECATAS